MTRKDYEKFARMLRLDLDDTKRFAQRVQADNRLAIVYAADLAARVFREDNPAFNRERFMQACGLES